MVKKIKSRHRHIKGVAFGTFGFCVSSAVCPTGANPEWMEVVKRNLTLKNLPDTFKGLKIVQVSDFHCSRTVSKNYLKHCVLRINSYDPDVILLTGDYITHDYYGRFFKKIPKILGDLKSRYGVYASLGNHDYGVGGAFKVKEKGRLKDLIGRLNKNGIKVLRNDSVVLHKNGYDLWFVGLGDLWAKDFEPDKAYSKIDSKGHIIALSHNPDTAHHMDDYHFDAMMSGHTHGSGFELKALMNKPSFKMRKFRAGLYDHNGKHVYVNRGLGRHGRWFNKRPEITIFKLC